MNIFEKMEIKVSLKNGYAVTVTITDPKQMLRIFRSADLGRMFLGILGNYREYVKNGE